MCEVGLLKLVVSDDILPVVSKQSQLISTFPSILILYIYIYDIYIYFFKKKKGSVSKKNQQATEKEEITVSVCDRIMQCLCGFILFFLERKREV